MDGNLDLIEQKNMEHVRQKGWCNHQGPVVCKIFAILLCRISNDVASVGSFQACTQFLSILDITKIRVEGD